MSEPIDTWLKELRRRGHDVTDVFVNERGQLNVIVDDEPLTYSAIRDLLRVPDAHFVGEGGALPEHVSIADLKAQAAWLDRQEHHVLHAEPGRYETVGGDARLSVGVKAGLSVDAELIPGPGRTLDVEQNLVLQAVVTNIGAVPEGKLIVTVAPVWTAFLKRLHQDPRFLDQLSPRQVEEFIAACYERDGWQDVILTPRSGDNGCDVIATKRGMYSIRIIDQVKAYSPGHRVTADDVRALVGTMSIMANVSKGLVTTTAEFAPKIHVNPLLQPLMPTRLELRDRSDLFQMFDRLLREQS